MPRRGDEANRLGNEYEGLWISNQFSRCPLNLRAELESSPTLS